MQLRRFTADSTPAALGAVRLALGEHAIILANRRLGDQVEIIATGQMDEASTIAEVSFDNFPAESASPAAEPSDRLDRLSEQTPQNSMSRQAESGRNSVDSIQSDDTTNIVALAEAIASTSSNATPVKLTGSSSNSRVQSEKTQSSLIKKTAGIPNSEDKKAPQRSDSGSVAMSDREVGDRELDLSTINKDKLTRSISGSSTEDGDLQLKDILSSQSEMINNHFRSLAVNLWGNHSPNHSEHLQQLLSLGIGAELAIRLVERADPSLPVKQVMRDSLALLKSTLPIGVDKTFSLPGITIVSGPPGAGKTTVVVKMAAQHVKACGRDSIVLICANTRRIGAFEELQAYGRILGVPTVHAHDAAELESLTAAFVHKQLVLIDHTLPGDDDAVGLPANLLKPEAADTVRQLFVLSADMQSATADSLISHHCSGRAMQCVLTNLDTTARLGELFSAIIRHHLPIAYWSDAASVQKPLQRAEASVLIAAAVAMSRRITLSIDDQWLHRLIQPTHNLITESPMDRKKQGVETR